MITTMKCIVKGIVHAYVCVQETDGIKCILCRFEKWFREALLPNISPGTLIVMDNASYHSCRMEVLPIESWTKTRLMEWLDEKGIMHDNMS